MIKKTLFLILGIIALQACNLHSSGTYMNDAIDKDKRAEIKLLDEQLLNAFADTNVKAVKALMSDILREKTDSILPRLVKNIGPALRSADYSLLDEFNVFNSKANVTNTLRSGKGVKTYTIRYLALNEEMYVSLLRSSKSDGELLVSIIYGNYGGKWKINILQFGEYSLFTKTAPEHYAVAKTCYEKGNLIDAVNHIDLVKRCLKPANEYFEYANEKEMMTFCDKVMKEVNTKYPLPMVLENIQSKPKLFRIFPLTSAEGFYPMVYYLSKITLKDTVALKAEYEKIKPEVERIFKGIEADKKFVFYRAFNEMPGADKVVDHYGFIDKH